MPTIFTAQAKRARDPITITKAAIRVVPSRVAKVSPRARARKVETVLSLPLPLVVPWVVVQAVVESRT